MSKRARRLLAATCVTGLVLSLGGAAFAASRVGALKQYKVPTARSEPRGITNGTDGNRWFTEGTGTTLAPPKIGQITPSGKIKEFLANCESCSSLSDIVEGSDGDFYMTTNDAHLLSFDPDTQTFGTPVAIAGGGSADNMAVDGDDIWFVSTFRTLTRYNVISGQVQQFLQEDQVSDVVIRAGSPWVTSPNDHFIKQIDPATGSVVDSFPTGNFSPRAITLAADGQLWFTAQGAPDGVGRLNPATRSVDTFLTSGAQPEDIAASPDGSVWFTQNQKGNIARIDNTGIETGVITETKVVSGSEPLRIVVDPDGNPWFTMRAANKIGAFVLR